MEITKKIDLKDLKDRKFPKEICFQPIGIIHSKFKSLKGIPIQFSMSESQGTIEIFPKFQDGLQNLHKFSHIYCIYYFDMVKVPVPLRSKPFLQDKEVGVFSMRTPFRPNPIGLSIFELLRINKNLLTVSNVDVLDKTPILDIKPYVSKFDHRNPHKYGWTKGKVKKMTS
ncbi:MAG: tRNA (N6-threonylcarbamoyladenosine(37)-N6)-methyltransferase TrmO [Promethearchaeota archaeon]|nr:MAG: tRNA (N6-threonylcarbamoyladenosine(37)-N6)-methyltransferase TrmO [Candidatus Lokiarchaeota archaeon]